MLVIHSEPPLRDPILLCAFSGWGDAAFAATGALRHLTEKYATELIAEFDPDEVYSYTITRPVSALASPGRRTLRWPQLRWVTLRVPAGKHDLVLLTGPEPDVKWRACVSNIAQFALRIGIQKAIGLGAFYAAVPHIGDPMIIGFAADSDLRSRLQALGAQETAYEGPTGFLTAVTTTLDDAGIANAAVYVAAPNYMSGANNPKLSAALLQITERLLGQPMPRADLEAAGREMELQIDEALRSRPDLLDFIRKMGGVADPPKAQPPQSPQPFQPPQPEELPSAEEVIRDLEEHLRRLRQQPPDAQ